MFRPDRAKVNYRIFFSSNRPVMYLSAMEFLGVLRNFRIYVNKC